MNYRIIFRPGSWVMKTTRYYNVYHSSEAFDDIYHTFKSGKIHARKITIHKVQEYDRFTKKWIDRIGKVVEYIRSSITSPWDRIVIDGSKIVLREKMGENEEE